MATHTIKKPAVRKDLKPYENKWVALVNRKVVAFGDSAREVARKAEKAGYKEYTFYLVPSSSYSYVL